MTTTNFDELLNPARDKNPVRRFFRHHPRSGIAGKNAYYWMSHPWRLYEIPALWWRQLGWMVQRGRKGYSIYDTWSLDSYILKWLPQAIADMRANTHSHPIDMTHDEWLTVLTTIEDGLNAGVRVLDVGRTDDETVCDREQFEFAWALMGKVFFNLWD